MIILDLNQKYMPIWLFVDLAIDSVLIRTNDIIATHVIPSVNLDISAMS